MVNQKKKVYDEIIIISNCLNKNKSFNKDLIIKI